MYLCVYVSKSNEGSQLIYIYIHNLGRRGAEGEAGPCVGFEAAATKR